MGCYERAISCHKMQGISLTSCTTVGCSRGTVHCGMCWK